MTVGVPEISYEEYIPTDKWSLQDWYLLKMGRLERLYTRIMRGVFMGGVDRRALIGFYAEVKGYSVIAKENIRKHLGKRQMERFLFLLEVSSEDASVEGVEELMGILSDFHWRSGLSRLSESRPLGDFAYARKRLGIVSDEKEEV